GWLTAEPPQIKYRVPHQLSWPMKRNVPAAIALKHLDAASRELLSRSEHIGSLGIASEGDDGRMFEQKQDVADLSSLAELDQLLLQAQTFAVVKYTELDDTNHRWQHYMVL